MTGPRRRLLAGVVIVFMILLVVVLCRNKARYLIFDSDQRWVSSGSTQDAADFRDWPLHFAYSGDLAMLVTDTDLEIALDASIPRWDPPTVPTMLHALRLWGVDARFAVPPGAPQITGDCCAFRRVLLDNDSCVRTVRTFEVFWFDTQYGIRPLTFPDPVRKAENAEAHSDQLLQVLAECNLPASEPVRTLSGRAGTIADILRDSTARFTLAQELEFTTIAYSRWLPPNNQWRNRFGESFSLENLADALVGVELGKGACQGCHVPFALTNLLLASEQHPQIISDRSRRSVAARLSDISLALESTELPNGGWDKRWSGHYVEKPDNVFFEFKPHFDKISVTGHQLEWIAIAPPAVRPSRAVIARAVRA